MEMEMEDGKPQKRRELNPTYTRMTAKDLSSKVTIDITKKAICTVTITSIFL